MNETNFILVIEIKNIYGNETIYPICNNAKKFCELLGQKTLTYNNLKIIKSLGYKIEPKQIELKIK